ncbi:Rpn family recombination-promoting nuclease/putative transposase [Acetobacterium sp.]|uniref:Rpn family recombination-promoting nuclease/putative transposase n=1 Tax=Acetobacterium sp. TaxID=1872094 RepID=UPI0039C88517
MRNYLPQNIMDIVDINSLESQKDSFINEELQETIYRAAATLQELDEKETGMVYFSRKQRANHKLACSWQLPVNQEKLA